MDAPEPSTVSAETDPMSIRALKDISFGSIAGMSSKVFEHPFDLTKVRLQSQVLDATARFDGPIDCLVQTWKKEGLRGLYRGLPAPIVGAMAENASLFWTYTEFQNAIRCTPIELVKCKMQVQMLMAPGLSGSPFHKLPGPISVLTSVIRTTGFRGLWLGQTATLIRETGGGAAWFASKEASAVSGAAAGIAYNVALFPADTVKSTIQTEAELRPRAPGKPGPTFLGTFRAMYAAQGIKGLYAGCGITVARAIPSSALIFLIYDGLSKRYGSQ
ncbi:mitochondrial carrier domain-containing protein [Fomitopsis serialis]|uniref:mitochondrial carrier domain-containing protein n=1 Tax=Fomitopsis serialis TaxID=139415 RepID=UPI00200872B3|nr:mitochondrial carrier domain-containing protein [Neoantrodia serialis]KAH9933919.1 mitochondrial carrier domain-containing protein [Neoantrodia serialis]